MKTMNRFVGNTIYMYKKKIYVLCVASVFASQCFADTFDPDIEAIKNNITAQLYGPLNRVLVCLNQDASKQQMINEGIDLRHDIFIDFLNIEYYNDVASCHTEIEQDEQQNKTIIAVVAAKPFKLSSNIPMYFYNIPYLNQEDADAFPNGVAHIQRHWSWLKHVFIEYILRHGWKRVAIVSDYSPYSESFEKELVEHLGRKEIVYNVQRCLVVTTADDCDFHSALRFLQNHGAVVIIANVEGQNALNLAEAARALPTPMTSSQYVWLVRDWPFPDTTSQGFKHVVSMTLSPKLVPYPSDHTDKGPHINSIRRGLLWIFQAVDDTKKYERIDQYYKSFAKEMTKVQYYECTGFIRKFTSRRPICINTLVVDNEGVRGHVHGPPNPASKIADLQENCMLRSNSYTSPCDDNWILYICVVWLMFILMMIMLVFFFNRCLVWT